MFIIIDIPSCGWFHYVCCHMSPLSMAVVLHVASLESLNVGFSIYYISVRKRRAYTGRMYNVYSMYNLC